MKTTFSAKLGSIELFCEAEVTAGRPATYQHAAEFPTFQLIAAKTAEGFDIYNWLENWVDVRAAESLENTLCGFYYRQQTEGASS